MKSSRSSAASSWGTFLIGTGIVSLVAAGVAGAVVLDAKSTTDAHCTSAMTCDSEGLHASDRGATASTVATVAFGVGAAALAGGILLVVFDKPRESRIGMTARPTAHGTTFALEGSF